MHVKIKHTNEHDDEQPITTTTTTTTATAHGGAPPSGNRNRRRCICISITLTTLTVALLILILALTVFKSKKPITTVNSVAISDVNATVNILPLRVSINITLHITVSVRNPNRIGFSYRNSSTVLRYDRRDIGGAPIPAGEIGSGETKRMNLTVTVFADRLLSDIDVYRDVIAGDFQVTTYTRISGKIRVLKLINIHVSSTSTCHVDIDILNRKTASMNCHYKNKL